MQRNARILAILDRFGKYVVQQARSNLSKGKRNVSKTLYNSIGYNISVSKSGDRFGMKFMMEDYGEYQDKGVHGVKSSPVSAQGSPYRYKNKMPPSRAFGNWVVKKGLKGVRDQKTGKFIPRKSLQYAIARSIYNHGIPATKFFSKPFNMGFAKLPPDLLDAFKIDPTDFK